MLYPEVSKKSGFEETRAPEWAGETQSRDDNSNNSGAEVRSSQPSTAV
jgi:hypothetical protein